jgi:hypothetical protein
MGFTSELKSTWSCGLIKYRNIPAIATSNNRAIPFFERSFFIYAAPLLPATPAVTGDSG